MKIKIRVKHLVLFALIPTSLLVILFNYLPSQTDTDTIVPPLTINDRAELLQKIESTTGSQRMELIRENVIETGISYDSHSFDVYIGASSSQWNNNVEETSSGLLPEDRSALLEEYIRKGPADYTLLSAVKQLAYENDALGQKDAGDQAFVNAEEKLSSDSYLTAQLVLLQAERALNRGNIQSANVLLEQLTIASTFNQADLEAQKAWIMGRLLFAQGKTREALTMVNHGLESYQISWNDVQAEINANTSNPTKEPSINEDTPSNDNVAFENGSSEREMQLGALKIALQSALDNEHTTPGIVSGTITRSDGTPVSRVGVFLRAESEVNHSVTYAEPYRIVTDEQGRFEFRTVIPGYYQLYIGVSFDQIDGWTWPVQYNDWIEVKPSTTVNEHIVLQPLLDLQSPINQEIVTGEAVDFHWNSVEGAAYYVLNGGVSQAGSSYSSQIRDRITDNQVTIPVDELYYSGGFSSFGSGDGFESIDPMSFLRYMNSETRYSWNIEAFDSQGRLITRSNGYRLNEDTARNLPFFYLKARELTAADQLLLDKKPNEAMEMYRQNYADDPNDMHALHTLIHMMTTKASYTKDKSLEAERIPLLKKLIQLHPSSNYAFELSNYYYDQADWKPYNEYYSQYFELTQQEPDSYVRAINATALLHQGLLVEAREQFAIALEEDDSHRFIGSYLAAELYAGESLSSVLELAKRYPEHMYGVSGYRWPLLIKQLIAESDIHPEDVDKQLKEKLGWYVNGQTERLESWIQVAPSSASALKKFMKAVIAVR